MVYIGFVFVADVGCCTLRTIILDILNIYHFTLDSEHSHKTWHRNYDNEACAVDLVMACAHEGPHDNIIFVSFEEAQSIMGRLGFEWRCSFAKVVDLCQQAKSPCGPIHVLFDSE